MSDLPTRLPHDGDAERAVLGAILLDPEAIERVPDLRPEDFYTVEHRTVFAACRSLQQSNSPCDLVTVTKVLRDQQKLDRAGGAAYVSALTDAVPDVANVEHYAAIVRESALRRQVLRNLTEASTSLTLGRPLGVVSGIIERVHDELSTTPGVGANPKLLPLVTLADLALADLPRPESLLVPILRRRELGMVYAPRGVGKTWLLLAMANALATGTAVTDWNAPRPRKVVYVDGEMAATDLRYRLLALANGDPAARERLELLGQNLEVLSRDLLAQRGVRLGYLGDPDTKDTFLATIPDDTDVVFLDNLSCLFGGEENDAGEWDNALDLLLTLKHRGTAVVFVHHAGKNGDQRGTSRREDALDFSLRLEPLVPDGQRVADGVRFKTVWAKTRSFRPQDAPQNTLELGLRHDLIQATWSYRSTADAVVEALQQITRDLHAQGEKPTVDAIKEALDQRASAEGRSELNLSRATVGRRLKELREAGLIEPGDDLRQQNRPQAAEPALGPREPLRSPPQTDAIWRCLVSRLKPAGGESDDGISAISRSDETAEMEAPVSSSHPSLEGETERQDDAELGPDMEMEADDVLAI